MDETDWESEAREYYAGNGEQFQVGGVSVHLRTLLIRTSTRSLEEALAIANSLLTERLPEQTFESLAEQYSEDEVGRLSGGSDGKCCSGVTQYCPLKRPRFLSLNPANCLRRWYPSSGSTLSQLLDRSPSRKKTF